MQTSATDIDLGHPDTYRDGVPHAVFAELRRTRPVAWVPEPATADFAGGTGFWAITRHRDVVAVARSPQLFSSHRGSVELRDQRPEHLAALQQMMVNLDPPDHSKLRGIVSRAFTPKTIGAMAESVAGHAAAIVAELEPGSEIDIVDRVTADMPLRVLADVLGIPAQERRLLYDWTNRLVGLGDPAYGGIEGYASAFTEMFRYAAERTAEKRARPSDDVWSLIVNAEVDGERLGPDELQRFFQLLVIAGNETTRNLLTGAVRVLDRHPDQRRLLLADPALYPSAVEEILRFRSPVIQFRRTATVDTEIAGHPIAEGDKVVIFYASANRDETVFAAPDTLDLRRDPNNHLAFGIGPHFCLGVSLARLEARTLLQRLYNRFPDLTVTGEPVRFRSNFINGIAALPVHLGASR